MSHLVKLCQELEKGLRLIHEVVLHARKELASLSLDLHSSEVAPVGLRWASQLCKLASSSSVRAFRA